MNTRLALRSLQAAFVFLTRLPLAGGPPFNEDELRWSSAYFPIVGLVLGFGLAMVHAVVIGVLGAWGAAIVTVSVSLIATGAFHEDGLADTFDAIGGGYTREKVLEILKDSRIGTYGAAALSMVLMARVICLASIPASAISALLIIESLSRAPPVVVLATVPYATRSAAAKSRDVATGGVAQAAVSIGIAAFILLGACILGAVQANGAIGLVALFFVVTVASTRYLSRTVGGITGDFLGAIQQLVALAGWLAWTASI